MEVFKDKRFAGVVQDPRFKNIPKKFVKTKVNKRFHGLFKDKRFEQKFKVDKRGSPLDHKTPDDYTKFYELDDDDEESDVVAVKKSSESDLLSSRKDVKNISAENVKAVKKIKNVKAKDSSSDEDETGSEGDTEGEEESKEEPEKEEEVDEEEEDIGEEKSEEEVDDEVEEDEKQIDRKGTKTANAKRKEPKPAKVVLDDTDEEDTTSTGTETSESEPEEEVQHNWHELDADAPRSSDVTRRLAICNMNWDRINAEDLLVVFNSFKPTDSTIFSIKVYPSEFGLERLEKEKLQGPAILIEEKLDSDEEDTCSKSKSRFHREKLRQYQISRLKYYYAVVDCDTPQTADALYEHLNGMEFESSGCIMDLRFIPDDMTFEQDPTSIAKSVSDPSEYKPLYFTTTALNQVKVDLTWDETDPKRKEILEKAFTDPESLEKDLKEYLASPSESEEEEENGGDADANKKLSSEEAIAKYKQLLQALEEKEKGKEEEEYDMEITWEPGLKEKTEELVKGKTQKENLTPFEEQLQKQKELRKRRKDKKKSQTATDDDMNSDESDLEGTEEENQDEENIISKAHGKNKLKQQRSSEAEKKRLAELELLMADANEKDTSESENSGNESKKKRRKKKKKKERAKQSEIVASAIDDPRFAALYTSHLFRIGPSDLTAQDNKGMRAFVDAVQRKKQSMFRNSEAGPSGSSGKAKKKDDHDEGIKEEVQKSISVKALKEKLTPFCKEFSKKTEMKKVGILKKQAGGLPRERHSTLMDELPEESLSRKRKKQQKGFSEVDYDGEEMAGHDEVLTGSNTSGACEVEDTESEFLIFSNSSSVKKQTSKPFSKSNRHVNSVKKKAKIKHVL